MKANRERRVPLSTRALAVLREAAAIRRGEFVFPAPATGHSLAVAALGGVFRDAGIDAVPHGFRSSFRNWAAERTKMPHAVMEAALTHVVRNRVEATYARSDLFGRRRAHDAATRPDCPPGPLSKPRLAGTMATPSGPPADPMGNCHDSGVDSTPRLTNTGDATRRPAVPLNKRNTPARAGARSVPPRRTAINMLI